MNPREAMDTILKDYSFNTVLDIGCGRGEHTERFRRHGKTVTPVDIRDDVEGVISGNYLDIEFEEHDCIWLSHVLEHQLNVNLFLSKVRKDVKEGGIVCITVPPLKHSVVGGHVSLWNAGVLMYNLVLAGFDCSDIRIKKYGYNISLILNVHKISVPLDLKMGRGDLEAMEGFFPPFVKQDFNGDIKEYNWENRV
jgi:SAM-dependent methyltransferase